MSVANLFNPPENEQALTVYTFNHMDAIRRINAAIFDQKGVDLPLYNLDPIWPDQASWLRQLQQAHNDFTSVLGIDGVDLTDVDFNDPAQTASWVRLNGEEIRQAFELLGIEG